MSRRWTLALVAVALLALACKDPGGATTTATSAPAPVPGYPVSMVALGDSVTAAFGTCFAPTSCPRNSWSTGEGLQVNSHYRRIRAVNPAIRDRARNLSSPGAQARDLAGQASAAVAEPADYVTILVGANDACAQNMTPVSAYRTELDNALEILKAGLPKARVLLVSLPDIYRVWEVGHTSTVIVGIWRSGVCPSLLANPTSTAAADVARRKAFRDRVAAYNAQAKAACTSYGRRCRFESIAGLAFDRTMLSAIDFFHPNGAGQDALARETYPGTFTW